MFIGYKSWIFLEDFEEITETMAPVDKELEQQIADAGNKLIQPPPSRDELLRLLDVSTFLFFDTFHVNSLYMYMYFYCVPVLVYIVKLRLMGFYSNFFNLGFFGILNYLIPFFVTSNCLRCFS